MKTSCVVELTPLFLFSSVPHPFALFAKGWETSNPKRAKSSGQGLSYSAENNHPQAQNIPMSNLRQFNLSAMSPVQNVRVVTGQNGLTPTPSHRKYPFSGRQCHHMERCKGH
jgi:hypothetical protein